MLVQLFFYLYVAAVYMWLQWLDKLNLWSELLALDYVFFFAVEFSRCHVSFKFGSSSGMSFGAHGAIVNML